MYLSESADFKVTYEYEFIGHINTELSLKKCEQFILLRRVFTVSYRRRWRERNIC